MKNSKLIKSFAALATLPVAALVFLAPLGAQDAPKVKRSGSMSFSVDPDAPGFSADRMEKQIRDMAKGLDLDADQQKQLEAALKDFREKAKPGNEKFQWKWEYNTGDADAPAPSKPQRPRTPGGGGGGAGGAMDELMKDLLQGNGMDPQRMGEEMMKRLMEQMGQGGRGGNPFGFDLNDNNNEPGQPRKMERRFFFEMGPDGKLRQKNDAGGNNDGNGKDGFGGGNQFTPENLQKMLGMGGGNDYDPDNVPRDSKYSRATLAEYRSVVKGVRPSTVSILREGRQVALGIVATADGHIITKASEVAKGKLEVETMDGKILEAKVLDRESSSAKSYDLALLKVEAKDLMPINVVDHELPVGMMLAASGIDEDPISVGVVSVGPRNFDERRKPILGVSMMDAEGGVGIREVIPGGPAEAAKIKAADVILSVNGEKVNDISVVQQKIAAMKPGDEVKLKLKSGDGEKDVTVKLGSREGFKDLFVPGIDPTARMGTNLSSNATGFPNALQNDLGINANQCGGPVVDIDGHVVGMNVARSGRTSTYMISGKTLKDIIAGIPTGKLGVVLDPATIEEDIKSYEAEVEKATQTLKEAQDRLKSAQEAKEKLK